MVAGGLAVVVLVLVVAQLVLPGIASHRLRDRLARNGQVESVAVHAFPAIELVWHQADRVVIRLGHYTTPVRSLGQSLGQSGDVGSLDASAQELDAGLLRLHDARLVKRGDRLSASATVTEADLRAALPVLQSVVPVASGSGQLVLQGTASLFGVSATVQAVVRAAHGKLVVSPNVPLGGFATLTLFSNPHVSVQSVAASPAPEGFSVRATALVH
jgi:hypothetical protein